MTKTKAIKPKIKATLKLLGKYYIAEGDTLQKTLKKLTPPVAKTLGILTLEKGKLKREKIIQPRIVMGLWGKCGQTMQDIAMKHITLLFGDFND
ncbi:MAG: hypothetical protein KKF54_08175 [Candidatus Omnitrophica bacterium]|nr:hypothetical protein [Candidatus Omnitrophota bacterium]